MVLTNDAVMPAATKAYLDSLSSKTIFAVGRAAAAAAQAYDDESLSIVGTDRYDTSRQVARIFFSGHGYAGLATGADWPDALAGVP